MPFSNVKKYYLLQADLFMQTAISHTSVLSTLVACDELTRAHSLTHSKTKNVMENFPSSCVKILCILCRHRMCLYTNAKLFVPEIVLYMCIFCFENRATDTEIQKHQIAQPNSNLCFHQTISEQNRKKKQRIHFRCEIKSYQRYHQMNNEYEFIRAACVSLAGRFVNVRFALR